MKKISTRIISLLTVFCMLFLSGCQGQSVKTETPEEFWARPHEWQQKKIHQQGASNEYGYYYVNSCDVLRYFDYKTKQDVALCNKVGCKHEDYNCEAYIAGGFWSGSIFFQNENLYIFEENDSGTHIYRCDLDATNREDKILLMKDEMEKGNAAKKEDALLYGDDLYYRAIYYEPADDSGEFKQPINAIRHIDLKKWTDEELCRSQESELFIRSADADGVLVFEKINFITYEKTLGRESKDGEEMFSNEELKEMPVEVFYCDKKAHNKLSLYKSNCADTYFVFFAEGSSLYMMNHSADASDLGVMGLERIDMRTGESEWLWNENAGKMTTVVNCVMWNDHIYVDLGKGNGNDMVYWTEIYSRDKFEKIELPFLKGGYEILDELKIEDGYGYIVYRETEDSVEYFLITPEEVDKENPECNMLQLTR